MKLHRLPNLILTFACAGLCFPTSPVQAESPTAQDNRIGFEVIGQVLNTSPQQSLQYGFLNFVRGLPRITTLPGPVSEATALFTFYNDTATERVINNGPIRVIDRTGTGTIYFDLSGNGSFGNPNTFRDGQAVQVCNLRHQVVLDTSTGVFTTTFEMEIVSAKSFELDGKTYRLGQRGNVYRLIVYGRLAAAAPPSAYIGGVAGSEGAVETD